MKRLILLFPSLLIISHAAQDAKTTWTQILGPATAEIPAPSSGSVEWRTDFDAALDEAAREQRPLFVTFRCLPCKQCADFDKTVLEGGPKLSPLLRQFVTVRMTDASKLDQRFFPFTEYQDLDLSWWGYFLSPQGELYGVFGGKDHVSDSTRISEVALANTMQRILAHHYDTRRTTWAVDGPKPDRSAAENGPKQNRLYPAFAKKRPHAAKAACLHCHQVGDMLVLGAITAPQRPLPERITQPWPLPENVGIKLDRDHGLKVTQVSPNSPAAQAGIQVGDELAMANFQRLFGQADFRGVLHRADAGNTKFLLGWKRGDRPMFGKLEVAAGWRHAENAWRKTIYDGLIGPGFGFFPLHGPRHGKGRMSFKPYIGKKGQNNDNPAWAAGIRPGMEIIGVNGREDAWDTRQLLAWFKQNHQPGDPVTLKISQGKGSREIRYTLSD